MMSTRPIDCIKIERSLLEKGRGRRKGLGRGGDRNTQYRRGNVWW